MVRSNSLDRIDKESLSKEATFMETKRGPPRGPWGSPEEERPQQGVRCGRRSDQRARKATDHVSLCFHKDKIFPARKTALLLEIYLYHGWKAPEEQERVKHCQCQRLYAGQRDTGWTPVLTETVLKSLLLTFH